MYQLDLNRRYRKGIGERLQSEIGFSTATLAEERFRDSFWVIVMTREKLQ